MCCASRAASASPSNAISGLARSPFCHGLTSAHAPSSSAGKHAADRIRYTRCFMRPRLPLVGAERTANLFLEPAFVVHPETDVRGDDRAIAPDQKRSRHSLGGVTARRIATCVERQLEPRRHLRQELIGITAPRIDVDADNLQALGAIPRLHLVEPRERLFARGAPRS